MSQHPPALQNFPVIKAWVVQSLAMESILDKVKPLQLPFKPIQIRHCRAAERCGAGSSINPCRLQLGHAFRN